MIIDIRRAQLSDAPQLPDTERSAAALFRADRELAWLADADVTDEAQHRANIQAHAVWVAVTADNAVAGFLSAESFGQELHIWEISVGSVFQGQGLGRRLLDAALTHGQTLGFSALTLTTFRELPWNEVFYRRFGFKTLTEEQLGQRLRQVLDDEVLHGLPAQRRCAMRYPIG